MAKVENNRSCHRTLPNPPNGDYLLFFDNFSFGADNEAVWVGSSKNRKIQINVADQLEDHQGW